MEKMLKKNLGMRTWEREMQDFIGRTNTLVVAQKILRDCLEGGASQVECEDMLLIIDSCLGEIQEQWRDFKKQVQQ